MSTPTTMSLASGAQLVAGTAWLFADPSLEAQLRLPLRRRGGPGLARQPGGDGHRGAQPRAARRPDAARPADPGRASRALGRVGARLPARRPGHGTARPRHLPADELAHARGRVPLHLRRGLRRPARARAGKRSAGGWCWALGASRRLRPTGIRFHAVEHEGCTQRSQAEAACCEAIVESLLAQRWIDKDGIEQPDCARRHPRRRALQLAGEPAARGPAGRACASARSTSSRGRRPRWCSSR